MNILISRPQREIGRVRKRESGDDFERKDNQIVVHAAKQIRLLVKVHIPVDEHPNCNFVDKLLGAKGNSLQQLQEATQTRMTIQGRSSMREKIMEEELRNQGNPKYAHLNEDLHVEVSAYAAPAETYSRISVAFVELQCFLAISRRIIHPSTRAAITRSDSFSSPGRRPIH
ncbi:KH domain-containing, RNA-binding, signal transduction-associated protein 1 [Trichonephila clavata]|uniref:KH domain-containing, RNA-binding, signal transduction-associated protein 1 n=1 Tax=Trichonephila clavata TaxID=2740835 RepID=A0A8X6F7U0_TRICU|nr:KH domain-containing, RNA-binding, signal transduction-associated protein 1 [Trichonephila clavata]